MRPLAAGLAVVTLISLGLLAHRASAGTSWGDASLTRDDVRIEIDENGRATITHSVALHVSGKKFRAFVIDGIEDGVEPATDDLAGRDGPGWPVEGRSDMGDSKGQAIAVFVEPAKEPRRLRVRLGTDGIGRGDYTLQIRYRVSLATAFTRDGAMTKMTWTAPRWPDGYDGAKIVLVVPAAKSEPRVDVADIGGEGEHPLDGFALATLHRGAARDEIEITRPHVPAHDDARFVLRVDPHALPGVAASAAAIEAEKQDPAPLSNVPRGRFLIPGLAAAIGLLLAAVHLRRDRAPFRAVIPGPAGLRALLHGACAGAAVFATWSTMPLLGAALIVIAIAAATLRAPRPDGARGPGRWLAIPEVAIPAPAKREPNIAAAIVAIAVVVAFALLVRRDHRAALALLMNSAMLLPLFISGTSRQLPPDRVGDAWRVLAPIARAFDKPKIIARTVGRAIDEVRIRLEGRASIRTIEIGCAIVHGPGGSTLVPEILIRVDKDANLTMLKVDDEHVAALGRTDDERTLCIRPAVTDPKVLRSRVDSWLANLSSTNESKPIARAAA